MREKSRRTTRVKFAICIIALVALGWGLWTHWNIEAPVAGASREPADDTSAVNGTSYAGMPPDYDPSSDKWPGASLGFVGPNGEGAISGSDFESNEEYFAAITNANSGVENNVERKLIAEDGGDGFAQGFLNVTFDRTCSEYDAHVIVWQHGGVWVSDSYVLNGEKGNPWASVYFPDAIDKDSLENISEALSEEGGIVDSSLVYSGRLSGEAG